MAINLAEAVKLKSVINKKIQETLNMTSLYMTSVVKEGETPQPHEYMLEGLEAELKQLRYDSRKLDTLIYRANIENTVTFKEEILPLVEAIELAIQLRAEVEYCKRLGMRAKEALYMAHTENILHEVTLYDPAVYRERATELEKEAHRLSNAINAKNYQVIIDFDDSKYF